MNKGLENALERERQRKEMTGITPKDEDAAFEFSEEHDGKITALGDCFRRFYRSKDYENALITLDILKEYCLKHGRGGYVYYMQTYEWLHNKHNPCFSYRDLIDEAINHEKRHEEMTIEIIQLVKDRGSILQRDLWGLFPAHEAIAKNIVKKFVTEGKLVKEKQGNSYILTLKND